MKFLKQTFLLLFSLILIIFGCLSPVSCRSASNQNNPHYSESERLLYFVNSNRMFIIEVSDEFDARRVALMRASLRHFNLLHGLTAQIVQRGNYASAEQLLISNQNLSPHVSIVAWRNHTENDNLIGLQPENTNKVLLDLRRLDERHNDRVFQAVFLHEVGHWLGMRHVCQFPQEREFCSPVGYGRALMNPFFHEDFQEEFSHLDLLEFDRVIRNL